MRILWTRRGVTQTCAQCHLHFICKDLGVLSPILPFLSGQNCLELIMTSLCIPIVEDESCPSQGTISTLAQPRANLHGHGVPATSRLACGQMQLLGLCTGRSLFLYLLVFVSAPAGIRLIVSAPAGPCLCTCLSSPHTPQGTAHRLVASDARPWRPPSWFSPTFSLPPSLSHGSELSGCEDAQAEAWWWP